MKVEDYMARCRELGISRAHFDEGFPPDCPGLGYEIEPRVDRNASAKAEAPPITEDLKRFESAQTMREEQRIGLMLARSSRPIYRSLAARKMTVAKLSAMSGVERNTISEALRGRIMPRSVVERVLPLLTEEERAMVTK